MKTYRFLLYVLICLLLNTKAEAQSASNKGTDFWLMYANHVAGFSNNQNNWQKMAIYITSDVNTTGSIEIPGINYNASFTVSANAVTIVQVPQVAYIGGVEGKFNKGIHLKSVKPVVAYGHIYDSSVSGATLLLPTNTLGKEYYSLNFTQRANSENSHSFCSVVAVEDNTEVIITASVNTQGGLIAGVPTTITLNRGEVYQILGQETSKVDLTPAAASRSWRTTGGDLTGTTIKSVAAAGQSCKKIAVFSGSGKMSIGCLNNSGAPGAADNLFQQVYPTSTWGKSFVTVPSKNRNYDIYRVFKSTANAVVKLNGVIIPAANFVNNLYYEFSSQAVNYIEGDNTIQVVQYQVTQGKSIGCTSISGDVGDPEMIFLNPLEQTLDKMTMYSANEFNILRHYINIVIRTSDVASFKLDGVAKVSEFRPVLNKVGYSYAQIEVSQGTHNLEANGGFNAIAYGFGANESYGYAAGASLISPGIEAIDGVTTLKKEVGCLSEKYDLNVSLPYQPLSLKLDLDNGQPAADIPLVLKETYTLNNITYYKYKLVEQLLFATAKKYFIKVSAEKPISDGCGAVDELGLEYEVVNNPTANFSALDKMCLNTAFDIIDTSQPNGSAAIVKWHWDYGDGRRETKTTGASFEYTYANAGNFTIKLIVENENGCLSPEKLFNLQVYALPVAKFVHTNIPCEQNIVKFEDQSTSSDGEIASWLWNFGDGTTSSDKDPEHTYSSAGEYDVKLTTISVRGCLAVTTKSVKVNPLPRPDFELPDFCLADGNAVFINRSAIVSNEVLTYSWDFGDAYANAQRPNTSTAINGAHVYTQTGIYEVTLTVKSASGCIAVVKKQFLVNGSIPRAAFQVVNQNNLCSSTEVAFKDIATVNFGEITKVEWFFDYANKSTPDMVDNEPNLRAVAAKTYFNKYPTFTNAASKIYVVKMKVYSGGSCVNEETKSITVYPDAMVDFSLQAACLIGGKANFDNQSNYVVPNASLTYLWDFGDSRANAQNPNTSTAKNPSHFYTQSGTYNVSLTVTTPFGCAKTVVKQINIDGAVPTADFTVSNANSLCVSKPVSFQDNATLAFGDITKIEWYYDFANYPNQVATDLNPGLRSSPKNYTYSYATFNAPASKNYVVKMVVYSGNTCLASVEKTITLKAVPDIDFGQPIAICLAAPAQQLVARERNNLSGTGQFSGNGVSVNGIFVPTQAGVGVHTIKYTYSVPNGCTVEKIQTVTVNATPIVDAGRDLEILEGGQATFTSKSSSNATYKWTPAKGLDRDDILNPTVRPTEDMTYTLRVTSAEGCFDTDEVKVKVLKALEIPSAITPNGDAINDVWNIKYIDSYPTAKVDIFDRAGQRVYSSIGYGIPFDGTLNNKVLPVGTYYYMITLHTQSKPVSGTLTIIR